MSDQQQQQPDTKPGNYYVTALDGGRHAVLAGPFRDNHRAALDMVEPARQLACELDPKGWFYAYGTARTDYTYDKPGALNERLGIK